MLDQFVNKKVRKNRTFIRQISPDKGEGSSPG